MHIMLIHVFFLNSAQEYDLILATEDVGWEGD